MWGPRNELDKLCLKLATVALVSLHSSFFFKVRAFRIPFAALVSRILFIFILLYYVFIIFYFHCECIYVHHFIVFRKNLFSCVRISNIIYKEPLMLEPGDNYLLYRHLFKVDFVSNHSCNMLYFQVLVVVSDGRSQDNPATAAEALRHAGITILAVGIGEYVNYDELIVIAGQSKFAFNDVSIDRFRFTFDQITLGQHCVYATGNFLYLLCINVLKSVFNTFKQVSTVPTYLVTQIMLKLMLQQRRPSQAIYMLKDILVMKIVHLWLDVKTKLSKVVLVCMLHLIRVEFLLSPWYDI